MRQTAAKKAQAVSMSLPQLVATIKACIVKADQAGDKYEQFSIATGKHLSDAKLRLAAKNKSIRSQKKAERTEQPQTWEDFVKEHFEFNQQRADLYIAIADGRKTVAKLRAEKIESVRLSRQRKKSPLRSGEKSTVGKARQLSRHEAALPEWEGAIKEAWLRDHPDKTLPDYEIAGTCGDTAEGEGEYHKWFDQWAVREGNAIGNKLFGTTGAKRVGKDGKARKLPKLTVVSSKTPEEMAAAAKKHVAETMVKLKQIALADADLPALIVALKAMAAKPTDRFADCAVEPADLETVADFLRDVAAKIQARKRLDEHTKRSTTDDRTLRRALAAPEGAS